MESKCTKSKISDRRQHPPDKSLYTLPEGRQSKTRRIGKVNFYAKKKRNRAFFISIGDYIVQGSYDPMRWGL